VRQHEIREEKIMNLRSNLPKAYLDPFFSSAIGYRFYEIYTDYDQLPSSCDLIGKTFFHNNVEELLTDIDLLLTKTNRLYVHFSEFNTEEMLELLSHPLTARCQCFYEMVHNDDQFLPASVIPWFLSGHNPYHTDDWALSLLKDLRYDIPKPKVFDCLLGSERTNRNWLEQKIIEIGFQDQMIYSYFRDDPAQGIWAPRPTGFAGDWPNDKFIPVDIYNDSYYSIVAESSCCNEFSFYTEKTAKPILAKRPFVYFAHKGYLRNLKKLGFRTFDSVLDESYDEVDDDDQRWNIAWQTVETLAQQDPVVVLTELEDVLQHNFDVLMNTDWWLPIKRALNHLPSMSTHRIRK
jgi:hypothetical protein